MQTTVHYAQMFPAQIVERRLQFPAAFVGLGILEWHGEHLAVGNDALKAERLCEMAARLSGGFVLPTVWYGAPPFDQLEVEHDPQGRAKAFMGFASEDFAPVSDPAQAQALIEQYTQQLDATLEQIRKLGMRAICLVCGHYPLEPWAKEAARRFNARHQTARAFAAIEISYSPADPRIGGDHAARWETSYLMHLRPECVDMSVYQGRSDQPLVGVVGEDPRPTASRRAGQIACELIAQGMAVKAAQLLEEAGFTPRGQGESSVH